MARNTLAGKGKGKSRSAKYYAKNPKARKKKQEYDKNIIHLLNVKSIGLS